MSRIDYIVMTKNGAERALVDATPEVHEQIEALLKSVSKMRSVYGAMKEIEYEAINLQDKFMQIIDNAELKFAFDKELL